MEFDSSPILQHLVHSMSDAVIYADAQGPVELWNSGAVAATRTELREAFWPRSVAKTLFHLDSRQ